MTDTTNATAPSGQTPEDRGTPSFETLAGSYNFRTIHNWGRLFTDLLIKECQKSEKPVRCLDIGCGRGIGRKPHLVEDARQYMDELWGLEPDESIPAPAVFDHYQHALMETADLPENHFDVAYSFMVMEHVADPDAFMKAVYRCLAPGGRYLFMTPNGSHYFTKFAGAMHKLKIDEIMLRVLRGEKVDEYHYPVQYKINTPRQIDGCASRLGFEKPDYVFVEKDGPKGYLPGPLKIVLHTAMLKRKLIKRPDRLLELYARVTKPANG